MSMFASASQLQKPKTQGTKRSAESSEESTSSWRSATQPAASAASWKRAKSATHEPTSMTQPVAAQHKPMLGSWFGATRASSSQQNIFARVKTTAVATSLSQDSEDDRPLARVATATNLQQEQQRQQQQQRQPQQQEMQQQTHEPREQKMDLRRMLAKPRATQQAKPVFTTAREAARMAEHSATSTSTGQGAVSRVNSGEDERVFQLSTKRRVTVRWWKSAVLVDIREYYDDNGVPKPGKKGISLAKDQWNTLMRLARSIDEAVALVEDDSVDGHSLEHVRERVPVNGDRTVAFTLSSKRRITVRFFHTAVLIDLREYYEQNNEMKPGKKGISLSKDQWQSLLETEPEITRALQEV